ncbi:hypothetical protein PPL_10859 [Heterostelium album PN500]|uniref:VPS10 domain-containing protein n=1 Tax=Heterostelium pallidum (strain ATCC 26659 / Pp 5 / PN500) TaxID=670386 RepID=D3BS67_HETP5|nr:hypothetical protein PPL_10859 [Heterostelium album PN500]EFA75804.1 hypothetical protein PPL_10859 [Heterostelium album PN500]|eukprot:XP_020427938.1 hypothetical protein PPL_10859 [Heterostelium album PN500]
MKISIAFVVLITALLAIYTNAQTPVPVVSYNAIDWNSMTAKYLTDDILLVWDTDGYVYRSADGGSNFVKIETDNVLQKHKTILVDPVYSSNVLLHSASTGSGNTTLYISGDYAATFTTVVVPDITFKSFVTHHWKSGYLLGLAGVSAYYSTDFGLTWQQVFKQSIVQDIVFDPHRDAVNPSGLFAKLLLVDKSSLVFSSDLGESYTSLLPEVNTLEVRKGYFVVYGNGFNLWTRSNYQPYNNNVMGFNKVEFDLDPGTVPAYYTFLDDSTSAIWMGLVMNKNDKTGSIYISDSTGSQFTLSLENVNYDNGVYDFAPQYGIPGIYFSNILTNPDAGAGKPLLTQSKITYQNGGSWSNFKLPPGQPCPACTYNFYGTSVFYDPSRQWGIYYSHESVPGLVLGNGNNLKTLSNKPDIANIQTRISRDSGLTWNVLYDAPSIYEFGNYGSIILLAQALDNVYTLYYSFDQGTTLQSFDFSVKSVDVKNIITDPDASGQKFLVFTVDSTGISGIFTIDFSQMGRRVCDTSDIETYTTPVVLGGTRIYSRLAKLSNCTQTSPLPGNDVDESECTAEDYECDIGYTEMNDPANPLVCGISQNYVKPTYPPAICPPGTKYPITSGYRKIADDICIGGVSNQYEPEMKDCPDPSATKSRGWVAAVVILVILAVIISGGAYYLYKNPDAREKILAKFGVSKDKVKYSSLGFKPNSLADDEFGIEDDDDAQILDDNDF